MSQQPMVVLSTSESDDDDGTESRTAFQYLWEKFLKMPTHRRLRGRPRKEVGGGRFPEEDLTWRAKRQKLQRAASEVATEATLDEALRGLRADAFSSATLAELQTMVYAATKVVVRVATTSQNLKATEDRQNIENKYGLTDGSAVDKLFGGVECGESGFWLVPCLVQRYWIRQRSGIPAV
ncbi:hypothetical protein RUM43_015063 [Polyplax serrata]|uniref:Uncharacterized protein n=1 Tax=Polyplax serrata TaxID=468196 RepID=A0AAN8NUI8_POLSC